MIRLLLVRHGQSEWNAQGRWQGQADPPLTNLGVHQGRTAAAAIGAVDAVFGSTLERARITAELIAEQLGIGPVVALEGLIERHAGEWQGLTRDEINEQYPGYLHERKRPEGWEPDEALLLRTLEALDQIVVSVGGERGDVDLDIVVVTHGGVIYQVEGHLGASFDRIANLGGRWVSYDGERWTLGDRLDLLAGSDITIPDQI